jgi:hypothetical protein
MLKGTSRGGRPATLLAIACGLSATVAWAANPQDQKESLALKAFVKPELHLGSSHLPVEEGLRAEIWGDVRGLDTTPAISGTQAVDAGFAYAGGRTPEDVILREPTLEIVPVAPPEFQHEEGFAGPVGQAYGHRLVWTWVFQRPPDETRWEVMVDAHSAEVIAFQALSELIVNGGFEGSCSPWLQHFAAVKCVQGGPFPHTGTGYTAFGNGNSQVGRMYQTVTIPAGTSPDLTFWLNVVTQETTTTQPNDKLYVQVRDTSNGLLATLAIYSNLDAGPYSQKGPFNLAAFAGQTIRMYFTGITNPSLSTIFRLDDVSLTSP